MFAIGTTLGFCFFVLSLHFAHVSINTGLHFPAAISKVQGGRYHKSPSSKNLFIEATLPYEVLYKAH